ncbi:UNVERIFIED_CONTAM: hypothetical protein PYX00_005135 [Menopon gallinae]|uniref:Protein PTHB1 n=1 Tax=Menopon gallinae TaxID=328185 RepID=A0AAW2HRB5_9NEOP
MLLKDIRGCHDKNLAILHPKLLTVYTLDRKDTDNAVGDRLSLQMVYQHQLRHSAYSFVVGPFGGGRGRDFICVQSLDGLLSFFEQETFAFQLYLTEFLLPSPFIYLEKMDCFVFLNSSLTFDCYSYENLASASQTENEDPKKIVKYWSYGIGESIMDVKPVMSDKYNIVVLTERNLYNISSSGKTIFMKRLEYMPMAFYAFVTAETKQLIILIATDNNLLNIYEGTCLKWSMKVDQIPVCVDRIILSNLYGGIVLLSQTGYLQCIYLGTHPSIYLMPPMNCPDISLDETEAELKRLQLEIMEKDTADPAEIDLLGVRLLIDPQPTEEENGIVCKISLEISNQAPINKIQVIFSVDPPLSVAEKTCTVSCCDKTVVDSYIYFKSSGAVSSLEVRACLSYVNSNGTPFVVERRGFLPLSFILVKTNASKEAKYKITLVTNRPVCPLNVLFREFEDGNANVIGLKYANSNAAVTVLTAKTTQRYRLQSDSLESIGLVLSALVERLRKQATDFSLSYDGVLPLQTFFEEVERYHGLLCERKSARDKLSKRTCQYRTIQKKVLVNLKDVTPKPISNLNNILTDTYEMILSSIEEIEGIEGHLETSRYSVNALSSLMMTLMKLMTISAKDLEYLEIIFSGNAYDFDDQGWLEVQSAAATYFLRTAMAKSVRDQQKPTDITLEPVSNVSKLVKTYSSVVDRVTKGTHLLERSEYENEKELLTTIPGIKEEYEEVDISVLPEGSKLADTNVTSIEGAARKEKRLMKQERGRTDHLSRRFTRSLKWGD